MKTITIIGGSIQKIHRHYGTGTLEEAMNSVYAEIVHFDYINWLPILEVCVIQDYLPENLLDICMNYFLWKGDIKKSAELSRILRFWRNKGLNDISYRRKLTLLKDLVREFTLIEESDNMRTVFSKSIHKEVYIYNSSYLYSSLKSLYYLGYLQNIMLVRIYFSYRIMKYSQLWEFGIRKLLEFTPYNPGIPQEWLNVYFSVMDSNSTDKDLFNHILPFNPLIIERKRDLFLVAGFDQSNGKVRRVILFKQNGENRFPTAMWRNEMFIN